MTHAATPHTVLMVRPGAFGFNADTAASNAFQNPLGADDNVAKAARSEFDRVTDLLASREINVLVVEDTPSPAKPDAVFPNNWFSTHADGTVVLYPMLAPNRRIERRADVVAMLQASYQVKDVFDLSAAEHDNQYLEGTGSVVFDHAHRIAYACRSPRTNEALLKQLCDHLKYSAMLFDAVDEQWQPIYHTNVMMWVGNGVAGLCLESIASEADQDLVISLLHKHQKKIVALSYAQMRAFAGNMFEVMSTQGDPYLLMSRQDYESLVPGQLHELSKHAEPLVVDIPTIERFGGGSIRCMVAGIYLPKQ